MIKSVIFDLDGTLVSTKNLHYQSLNQALQEISPDFVISEEDHLKIYDGLPTNTKLKMLSEKGLPSSLHRLISDRKKQLTTSMLKSFDFNVSHVSLFKNLKKKGFKIAICTNAIRETLTTVVDRLNIGKYVDVLLSNEDVSHPKPNPEIYNKCFSLLNLLPEECLVFEDSEHGIISAQNSGSWVRVVDEKVKLCSEGVLSVIKAINFLDTLSIKTQKTIVGSPRLYIHIECVRCGITRPVGLNTLRNKIKKFSGNCKICNVRSRSNGISVSRGGYVMIRKYILSEEELAFCLGDKDFIWEHRLVMSKYLNRPLYQHENVHHINGERGDNRLENLELWSTSQPSGQRVKDKIEWCKKFLKEYGYDS